MIDDYLVLRAMYRRRRPMRRLLIVIFVLLCIGALIYAAAFLSAVFGRMH
jgi:uncharacterized SAM-binding protein YcdF (DUF218 family)